MCGRPGLEKNGGKWEDEVRGVKEGKGRGCTVREFRFVGIGTSKFQSLRRSYCVRVKV